MNDRDKLSLSEQRRRLADALRDVRIATAERDDVVVEMREAARMRLELLAQDLAPVFAEVPAEEIQFDFAISSGLNPRLWIDPVSHVAMGRDRRTYRFVRDTRLGRTVLAESTEIRPVADAVTRYIAERMLERQRWLDGTVETVRPVPAAAQPQHSAPSPAPAAVVAAAPVAIASTPAPARDASEPAPAPAAVPVAAKPGSWRAFLSGLGVVVLGAGAGLAILAAVYWDRLAAYVAAR